MSDCHGTCVWAPDNCTYIYTCVRACTCLRICLHICICVCICICICIYACVRKKRMFCSGKKAYVGMFYETYVQVWVRTFEYMCVSACASMPRYACKKSLVDRRACEACCVLGLRACIHVTCMHLCSFIRTYMKRWVNERFEMPVERAIMLNERITAFWNMLWLCWCVVFYHASKLEKRYGK